MFNNVYIIQFDNLPNPKKACQNIQTWMHVQARDIKVVVIWVDPFMSTVLYPIITYWKNNKLASQDFRDSMQNLHVYDNFIITSIKIQIFLKIKI